MDTTYLAEFGRDLVQVVNDNASLTENMTALQTINQSVISDLNSTKAQLSEMTQVKADNARMTIDMNEARSRQVEAETAVASLKSQVANLQAMLDAVTAPAPSTPPVVPPVVPPVAVVTKFNIGSSRPTVLDPVLASKRVYFTGTDVPARPTGGPAQVLTWKNNPTQASIDARLKSSIVGDRVGYWHEPDDDVELYMFGGGGAAPKTSGLDPAAYRQRTIKLAQDVVRTASKARPVSIIMEWSLNPQAPQRRQDLVTAELWTSTVVAELKKANGILGVDVYAGDDAASGPKRTYDSLFSRIHNLALNSGLDWGVYETGAKIFPDASPAVAHLHAVWWKGLFEYLGTLTKPPVDFLLWNQVNGTTTFEIDAFPEIVQVWREAITKYSPGSK